MEVQEDFQMLLSIFHVFSHINLKHKINASTAVYHNCYCLFLATRLDAYLICLFSQAITLHTNLIFLAYLHRTCSFACRFEAFLILILNISMCTCVNQEMNRVVCLNIIPSLEGGVQNRGWMMIEALED